MRWRTSALVVAAVMALGACGGDDAVTPGGRAGARDDVVASASPDATKAGRAKKGDKDDEGSAAKRGGAGGGGTTGAGGGAGEGGAEDDGSSRWYPERGLYVYAQSGSEEFCDASGCSRDDLPPTQEVRTTYDAVSDSEAIVVTAAEASDNRFVRTTTRHTPSGAFVTHVRLEFDYQGARFENDYKPDPPVEVARLPLRAGMSWRGQWDARTSGNYSVDVGDREAVNAGGRTVQAWPLRIDTTFRGDFEGTSNVTVWVDPATAAVVKTVGRIDVSSFFGDYRTNFEATLRSAPGYR